MSECRRVLPQIRPMADGVFDDRGGVDGATGADAVGEEGSIGCNLRSLGGRHEIVADEVIPRMRETVESVGTDMQWLGRIGGRIRPLGVGETHLLQKSLIIGTLV